MTDNLLRLYPTQSTSSPDRRQNAVPVELERRSGTDRRLEQRVNLSPDLKNDVKIVKNKFDEIYSVFKRYDSMSDFDYYKALNDKIKNKEIRKTVFSILSPIVPFRRISSLPDNIEDGNYERAAGLVALAVVNLPEDTRDIGSALKQVLKGELPKYDYKEYQAPFSFFRGTALQPLVNKMGKVGEWLYSKDKTLYHTKFGEFLTKILKIDMSDSKFTGRKVPNVVYDDKINKYMPKEVKIKAYKLNGKPFSKLVGRALLRIPIISVFTLSFLELPSIIKSFSKPKNTKNRVLEGTIQVLKSGINVVSILSGISLIGALFARRGPAGSLVGMGIGSVIGSSISKHIGKEINDLSESFKN